MPTLYEERVRFSDMAQIWPNKLVKGVTLLYVISDVLDEAIYIKSKKLNFSADYIFKFFRGIITPVTNSAELFNTEFF